MSIKHPLHEQVGLDLDVRGSVVYTKTAEERLLGHHATLYNSSVQMYSFGGYLQTVHIHHKMVETKIPEVVRFSVRQSKEIGFSEHREEQGLQH